MTYIRSRLLRFASLCLAAVASIATSGPEWRLDAQADAETFELAAGASFERRVAYEGSHGITVKSHILDVEGTSPRLLVAHDDSNPSSSDVGMGTEEESGALCDTVAVYASSAKEGWRTVLDGGDTTDYAVRDIQHKSSCNAKSGTVTIRIENQGSSSVRLTWRAHARIGEVGSDDVPEGAWVKIRRVP